MKNHTFLPETGLVEQTNISDGDDIFIVLKDTIKKVLDDKDKEEEEE
jgi:hypothetical protein